MTPAERSRCPDPRCGKPRATEEDNDRKCPSNCRHCAALCWYGFNTYAHDDLPAWETWAPKALNSAWRAGRDAAVKVVKSAVPADAQCAPGEFCEDFSCHFIVEISERIKSLSPEEPASGEGCRTCGGSGEVHYRLTPGTCPECAGGGK